MTAALMLALFAGLMVLGMPIAHAMGLAAALALLWQGDIPILIVAQRYYDALDSFPLLAVPLFILAGELMTVAGITERLVGLSRALMGHLRGGLAQANILSNMFMAAISGSAVADLAAIGSMMIPAMKREGYRPDFAVAVTSCAAMMAPIIPPSVIAVIYGSVTELSIGALFLAGAIPGVLAGLSFMVLIWIYAPHVGAQPSPRVTAAALGHAFTRALPALAMPLIVIGGIIGGAFTPTEASAIAVTYALLFGLIVRRHSLASLYANLWSAVATASSALITLGGAAIFGWVLARGGAADLMLRGMQAADLPYALSLLLILALLFVVGLVLEPVPALVLCVPVLTPMVRQLGIDPIQFGIAAIMMLVVGSITPPVGVLAMLAAKIAGVSYGSTVRMLIPFVAVWLLVALLVAFVPPLALLLPSLMAPAP